MRNEKRVKELLEMLKSEMTTPRELKIIEEFEMKLNFIMPEIEIIDENRKKFNGIVYYKNTRDGRFVSAISIYKAVWRYFYGEVCKNCGKEYDAVNVGRNGYCSKKCAQKALREVRICEICGKKFSVSKYESTKCCSKKCTVEYIKRFLAANYRFIREGQHDYHHDAFYGGG